MSFLTKHKPRKLKHQKVGDFNLDVNVALSFPKLLFWGCFYNIFICFWGEIQRPMQLHELLSGIIAGTQN